MESREAPLDTKVISNNCHTYMVTVNVSPKKFVSNNKWIDIKPLEQECHLLKQLKKCIDMFYIFDVIHRFEFTQAGQKHLHFTCYSNDKQMECVQLTFHKKFGMPNLDPSICCMVTKTAKDVSHAVEYVTKEDSEVPTQNMFLKHKK